MNIKLIANKALFILLAMFVFKCSMSDGLSTVFNQSGLVFYIELIFILLYTLINLKLPGREIVRNPYVIIGLLSWFALISTGFLVSVSVGAIENSQLNWYMAFHAVFAIYAVAIIREMHVLEDAGHQLFFLDEQTQKRIFFGFMCLLTFSIALTSGNKSFDNADIVLKHELVFVFAYIFIFKSAPDFSRFFREHRFVTILLLSWFFAVTISLIFSPYQLIVENDALNRYQQTFFHAVFFIFAYQFLLETKIKNDWVIMLMLPLSAVIHSAIFVITWLSYDVTEGINWLNDPPLSSHIRHTGYIATAASVAAMTFLLHQNKSGKQAILYVLLLLIPATLLFWTGGRAATLSFFGSLILMVAYLAYTRNFRLNRLVVTCLTLFLAIYLSELFHIFDWNGVLSQISRTESAGSVASFTTNRTLIWKDAIETLNGNWLLGFGPQGYFFMAERIFPTTVQPHNIFLQFVIEWGLVGSALFLALLLWAAVCIINAIKNRSTVATTGYLSGVAVLMALTVHGLTDGTYYHAQSSYYIVLSLAVCLSAITGKRNLREPLAS